MKSKIKGIFNMLKKIVQQITPTSYAQSKIRELSEGKSLIEQANFKSEYMDFSVEDKEIPLIAAKPYKNREEG